MPHKVIKKDGKWVVVNKETGKVKGTHETKDKALAQMRLLYALENGYKIKNKKKK